MKYTKIPELTDSGDLVKVARMVVDNCNYLLSKEITKEQREYIDYVVKGIDPATGIIFQESSFFVTPMGYLTATGARMLSNNLDDIYNEIH